MKKILITLTTLGTMASTALAGEPAMVMFPAYDAPQPVPLYRAHEFQIELFGSYVFEDDENDCLFGDDDGNAGVR